MLSNMYSNVISPVFSNKAYIIYCTEQYKQARMLSKQAISHI